MTDWIHIVQTVGVPVAILAAMGAGIWRAFTWAAPIGHKLAEKHASLVDKLESYLDSTSTMLDTQAKHLDQQQTAKLAKLQEIHTDIRGVAVDVKEIKERVRP